MDKKIKVEIWSDVVCPFCYLGKKQFNDALEGFEHKDEVEVVWRSFELDPETPFYENMPVNQRLAQKYGVSIQEADAMTQNVTKSALEHGLIYNLDKSVVANTFNAHRLMHHATEQGLGEKANEELFKAYFTDALHIGKPEILQSIARSIGLDEEEASELLEGTDYSENVKKDQETAKEYGISGVPFFLFNNKYYVSGARGTEAFTGVLNKIWEEESGL